MSRIGKQPVQLPDKVQITLDGDTTRFNLVGTADWTLSDMAGGAVTAGDVSTFTSYSATGSNVATQAAQADASARLAVAMADLIVSRLLLAAPELGL